mgnify:FL=1
MTTFTFPKSMGCGMSDMRIAYWRVAHSPAGREIELHPWRPSGVAALKAATIRHCVGCADCGEAVEVDPPCPTPRWCSPERPCEGRHTAQKWAREHITGTATTLIESAVTIPAPPKTPATTNKGPGHKRPWTDEEDAWLCSHPRAPIKKLAKDLDRGVTMIVARRRYLEISSPPRAPWSAYEDRLLRSCSTMREAMRVLPARSGGAIRHRASSIGHSFREVDAV